jgi:hypothetical protein
LRGFGQPLRRGDEPSPQGLVDLDPDTASFQIQVDDLSFSSGSQPFGHRVLHRSFRAGVRPARTNLDNYRSGRIVR